MASSQQNDSAITAASLFNVNGLVAFVTGGGTGIGLMISKALAKNGASKVYIAGRRLDVLQAAAASIGSASVIPIQCDVTSKTSLQEAVAFIEKDVGHLNLLLCNSGINGPRVAPIKPETTVEEWANDNFAVDFDAYVNTFAVNSAAVWFTAMAFLKLLDAGNKKGNVQQTSQVIVTSSIAAFNKKAPNGWAYGQSKAAATTAMRHLSVALPQWDIRANCIAPGYFPSEMSASVLKNFTDESGGPVYIAKDLIPLQRIGDEQDMAGTILHLASRAGAYCNGVVVVVDGGRLTTFPSVL